MTSSTAASACSWVSFSFLTSRANCPPVTLRASVRPASTNSCLTSLRTTSIPAAAMVWAIWPPIVPAPTTAALKMNMAVEASPCRHPAGTLMVWAPPGRLWAVVQPAIAAHFTREAVERADQRLALARPDEDPVHSRHQRPRLVLLELVLEQQRDP